MAARAAEFEALEAEWAGIVERRDAEAARAFLADDFVLSSTGGVGPSVPKDEWLAALDEIDTRSLVPREVDARVFGDVAVVSARLRWDATLRDQDLTGDYAVTDVFTRGDDRWLASWRISVRLP
ncbi:MAG: nuclear transport factor 2 family protein [Actinobacteria bacterium]|nr:MAG: nuclear transport factor 2 family protein [Actinomycetota bacterium]